MTAVCAKTTGQPTASSLAPTHCKGDGTVADLVFLVMIAAFFGVAMLLLRACDAIIGPDEQTAAPAAAITRSTEVAA